MDDIGPIILGRRVATSKSADAYQALIYNKGALVLRMLNFLMANPSNGDEKPFVAMMSAFVDKYRGGSASTEEFQAVAGEHFARTPIAQKFGMTNLDWFFNEWVYRTGLPTYNVDYEMKDQGDGTFLVTGNVQQLNVPADWVMPLPIVFTLSTNQVARTTILAKGPSNPFQLTLRLPSKPVKVEIDPSSWILSEKTTIKGK
jgi:aminopeptidase N